MTEFARLRERTGLEGVREQVRVNQRHLVDKILARYSGESVVWRELLQNSDDAGARRTQIEFRTELHGSENVTECLYRNNGAPFREEDWHRLRSIAEGNPDESKIGFFGVGFYAVFSISEEPMVVSGKSCMLFGWDRDALFCSVAAAEQDAAGWTTFVLPCRDPFALPPIDDIGRFAANCLTFSRNIEAIEILVNGKIVAKLERKLFDAIDTTRGMHPFMTRTPSNFLSLVSAAERKFIVSAQIQGAVVSSREASLFNIVLKSSMPRNVAEKMERVTKKRPPRELRIAFVVSAEHERATQTGSSEDDIEMTREIVPKLGTGRVFIGFPTHQTTGAAFHISAPLVPTVERETIDFVQPTLGLWNRDILYIAGSCLRSAYEESMKAIQVQFVKQQKEQQEREEASKQKETEQQVDSGEPRQTGSAEASGKKDTSASSSGKGMFGGFLSGLRNLVVDSIGVDLKRWSEEEEIAAEMKKLLPAERAAVELMRSHTFIPSSPDKRVGEIVLHGFLSAKASLSVMTSIGVHPADNARVEADGMEEFVSACPVVKRSVGRSCYQLMEMLTERGFLRPLQLHELIGDLEKNPLLSSKFIRLLKWWPRYLQRNDSKVTDADSKKLKNAIVVVDSDSNPIPLATYTEYTPTKLRIPEKLPLPPNVLPREFAKTLLQQCSRELRESLWFQPLTFEAWTKFMCGVIRRSLTGQTPSEEQNAQLQLALRAFNEHFTHLPAKERVIFGQLVKQELSEVACLETSLGRRRPCDTYLPNVKLFADLPRVPEGSFSRGFLTSIGVREHVDLNLVFSRLDSLQWDPIALIRYLTSIQESLNTEEWGRLSSTNFLPVARPKSKETQGEAAAESNVKTHAHAKELYLPDQELHALGFPTLEWKDSKGPFRKDSNEGKFLRRLGVREHPTAADVIQTAVRLSGTDRARHIRMVLFLAQHTSDHYSVDFNASKESSKFIPASIRSKAVTDSEQSPDSLISETPKSCFSDPSTSCLNLAVVDEQISPVSNKLGVREHPSSDEIMKHVKALFSDIHRMPSDRGVALATEVFSYLNSRSSGFDRTHWRALSSDIRIPFTERPEAPTTWHKATEVYFKSTAEKVSTQQQSRMALFRYIDFGPQPNAFLRNCGVRDEPSTTEVASTMATNPSMVMGRLGGHEQYLALLREVAVNYESLPQGLRDTLKRKEFLLGFRADGFHSLCRAVDCSLVDDTILQQMFDPLHAPLDSTLETFYERLGSKWLSKEVTRKYVVKGPEEETECAVALKKRILERAPLLLTDSGGRQHRSLRPGAAKLLTKERLQVREATSIDCELGFRRNKKTQAVTGCRSGSILLLVLPKYDMFDVSNALGDGLFERNRLEDSLLLATILETSLGALKSRGFPVERLAVADVPPANPRNPPPLLGGSVNPAEPVPVKSAGPGGPSTAPQSAESPGPPQVKQPSEQFEGYVKILSAMYPDASEAYIRKLLQEQKGDPLRGAKEALEKGKYLKRSTEEEMSSKSGPSAPTTPAKQPKQSSSGLRKVSSVFKKALAAGSQALPRQPSASSKHADDATSSQENSKRSASSIGESESAARRAEEESRGFEGSGANRRQIAPKSKDGLVPTPNKAELNTSLRKAVSLSGPQNRSSMHANTELVRRRNQAMETSHCEVIPGHDLVVVKSPAGVPPASVLKIFRTVRVDEADLPPLWGSAQAFSKLLRELGCHVFQMDQSALCIFYGPNERMIAFNTSDNHALHFNLWYFLTLEHEPVLLTRAPYVYWYFVFCHELAHNIVSQHDEVHEFYFQSFAENYFNKLMEFFASSNRLD